MMLPKKNVTEKDIEATEARLSGSYARLKQAITNIPSDAVRPVTDTVKSHPYATVAAAAGAGFVLFQVLNVLMPRTRIITSEVSVQPEIEIKEVRGRSKRSFLSKLLSQAVAAAMPYITSYVQNEVTRMLSKPRENEAAPVEPEKAA